MALKLKADRTFTDKANVVHAEAFFGVYQPSFALGRIQIPCGIWKDEDSFIASMLNGSVAPIQIGMEFDIVGPEFISYFMAPITPSKSPISVHDFVLDQIYAFLTDTQPNIPGIVWDDWENVAPEAGGLPATKSN